METKLTLLIILCTAGIFSSCSKMAHPSNEDVAKQFAVDVVSNSLIAPTTAKFSNVMLDTNQEKNVLLISGRVDAQNSYGAMLRHGFICVLTNSTPGRR